MRVRLFALVLPALVAACGGTATVDGGLDMGTPDAGGTDAGTPDSGPPPAELYGACTSDAQCPGTGAVCRRNVDGWPGGYCTVPCTDRTPCDDGLSYNHCIDDGTGHSWCERRCLNGGDCRDGYSCEGNYAPADGRCIPVCSDDATCGAGAMCQAQTARCVATGTAAPAGAAVGAACASGADCASGTCQPEMAGTAATGFVRGQCVRNCVLPPGYNSTSVFSGADLPQSNCEAGDVCIPISGGGTAMLDLGVCLTGCRVAADCRVADGYTCAKDFGTVHFGVGFCRPADCTTAGCPTGYVCHTTSGGGFCARM